MDETPTVFVHAGSEAFVEATGAALVAVGLVHRTAVLHLTLGLTRVNSVSMDTPLEEARTTYETNGIPSYHC